ncbi:MAG TPA: NHL repeat-containing protein [Acidobacteriota bacterium]
MGAIRRGVLSAGGAAAARPGLLAPAALITCLLPAACAEPDLSEWTLQLTEELTIGAEPVTPETAFYNPKALGFDFTGNVFVLDADNHRVQVFDPRGGFLRSFGEAGVGPGQLQDPQGMFVHPDGRVWVADTSNRRLQPYSPSGVPLDTIALDAFPLDVVVAADRIFLQRFPRTDMTYGPDPSPLIRVLDRSGNPTGGFADPVPTPVGVMYLLENVTSLAPAPGGGVAIADSYFSSRIRVYEPGGALAREIPVLYKAGAWAPLGRRPTELNDESLQLLARTSSDLAWDERRGLFWLLAGNVDRNPDGEWIIGTELYRYDPNGVYHGSLMLPQRNIVVAVGPDGRVWTIDIEGVVHAFRVSDPDMAPEPSVAGGETP